MRFTVLDCLDLESVGNRDSTVDFVWGEVSGCTRTGCNVAGELALGGAKYTGRS